VDILAAFPGTYPVDGLLGGDFLEHLTLTLEYYAKRLELTSALSDRQGDRVVRLLLMCTSRVAHTWFGRGDLSYEPAWTISSALPCVVSQQMQV
jgi:hypothetical protein